MIRYVNLANCITSGSLACGFAALVWAAEDRFGLAAAAIVVAAVLDGLDGLAARMRRTSGRFGSNLDTLADVTAFGAAPGLMLARGPLDELPVVGMATAVLFVTAGAWRLARFSIVENRDHWVGLPIPTAGIVAAGGVAAGLAAWPLAVVALVLALLMVSEIPFPTASGLRAARRGRRAPADAHAAPDAKRRRRPRVRRRRSRGAGQPPVPVGSAPPHEH
jgi:CDP-diacylglycerol--serine O-phosphatidyltransferase